MFTLGDIQAAHATVKSGGDFPRYVQDLNALGVLWYQVFVTDGRTEYFGSEEFSVESLPLYESLVVGARSDRALFLQCLKLHQSGGTDYMRFCEDMAAAGIEKWIVDIKALTCTYYDKANTSVFAELIPQS